MKKNLKLMSDNNRTTQENAKRSFNSVIKGMLISSILVGSVFTSELDAATKQHDTIQSPSSVSAVLASTSVDIKTVINGVQKKYKQSSVYRDGKVLVPMQSVFKDYGAKITQNKTAKTMTATKGKTVITVTLGSDVAKVNGTKYKMKTKAISVNGTIMVPTSIISKLSPVKASYNKTKKTVTIAKLASTSKVGGISVKYGYHTYGSRSQYEYDKVVAKVKSALDSEFDNQYLGGSPESEHTYKDYINGERWDGDLSNRSKRSRDLKNADNEIGYLVKNNISETEIKTLYKTAMVANLLGRDKKDPGDGTPRSAYDALFRGVSDCDSSSQLLIGVFDHVGYDTSIVGGDGHADPYVKIDGKWYIVTGSSFRPVINFNFGVGDTFVLASPTSGKF